MWSTLSKVTLNYGGTKNQTLVYMYPETFTACLKLLEARKQMGGMLDTNFLQGGAVHNHGN